MTCQQDGCTRKGELACMVGETQKVLCIEHQARYRQAQSCGGRTITIHHGVDLEDWSRPAVRRAMPAQDVPDLGLPLSSYVPPAPPVEQLPAVIAAAVTYGHSYPSGLVHTPPAPPVPPSTLKVIMNKPRPLCLWPECDHPSQQGVCCMLHNDRLRKLYGTAARLTEDQINAAPPAWEERMIKRDEAAKAQLSPAGKAKAASIVKTRPVVPASLVDEVATVKAIETKAIESKAKEPDVAAAKILLNIARNLAAGQPDIQLMLDAAIMVLR